MDGRVSGCPGPCCGDFRPIMPMHPWFVDLWRPYPTPPGSNNLMVCSACSAPMVIIIDMESYPRYKCYWRRWTWWAKPMSEISWSSSVCSTWSAESQKALVPGIVPSHKDGPGPAVKCAGAFWILTVGSHKTDTEK